MTRRQLLEWLEFDSIDPFGEEREDLRMGILAATFSEPHRDSDKRKEPFTPADFMPDFEGAADPEPEPQDVMTDRAIENSFRMLSSLGFGAYTEAPA